MRITSPKQLAHGTVNLPTNGPTPRTGFGHPLIFEVQIPYSPFEQPQFELRRNSLK